MPRRLALALLLAGAALLAVGFWPRASENGRTFDPETGVVSHEQTTEMVGVLGLAMCAAGLTALALSLRRP